LLETEKQFETIDVALNVHNSHGLC